MKGLRFGQTNNPDPKSLPKQVPVCYKCLHDYLTRKILTWKYLIYFGGVPGVSYFLLLLFFFFFGGGGVGGGSPTYQEPMKVPPPPSPGYLPRILKNDFLLFLKQTSLFVVCKRFYVPVNIYGHVFGHIETVRSFYQTTLFSWASLTKRFSRNGSCNHMSLKLGPYITYIASKPKAHGVIS